MTESYNTVSSAEQSTTTKKDITLFKYFLPFLK